MKQDPWLPSVCAAIDFQDSTLVRGASDRTSLETFPSLTHKTLPASLHCKKSHYKTAYLTGTASHLFCLLHFITRLKSSHWWLNGRAAPQALTVSALEEATSHHTSWPNGGGTRPRHLAGRGETHHTQTKWSDPDSQSIGFDLRLWLWLNVKNQGSNFEINIGQVSEPQGPG